MILNYSKNKWDGFDRSYPKWVQIEKSCHIPEMVSGGLGQKAQLIG